MKYYIILCIADVSTEHHIFTVLAWTEQRAHAKAESEFHKEHQYPKNMVKLEHTVTLYKSFTKRVSRVYLTGFIHGLQSSLKAG